MFIKLENEQALSTLEKDFGLSKALMIPGRR